jgi:hypothetical protein
LLDPSLQTVPLDPLDVEQLYALCEYGSGFTNQADLTGTSPDADFGGTMQGTATQELASTSGQEDLSGHIDGIIPQMFGHTDTDTIMANLSYALGDRSRSDFPLTDPSWPF